ncbi:alpha/beta hydrolase [Streptomyces beijiangensis]|uniref:Alpha/beta hydrolase n=1 Tax=Streptomyces beijiangensis TaxID=163361 RepID=A0A939F8S9_9ACTN|nr:alpha/beta hydrolase [Streptomyces beijiangensis]MBO0513057.1 alpha/beta hydrolase [Streptomyces beijiangensis]
MSVTREKLELLGGRITGIAALPTEPPEKALLVYVHGGGANATSFDIPGHSQLELAALNGFPAFALDRPGSGDSVSLGFSPDSDSGLMRANAERLLDAVGELWQQHQQGSPGVVLVGCSIGGAITLHLAALWGALTDPSWPLLGVAVSDIGQVLPPAMVGAWDAPSDTEYAGLEQLAGKISMPPLWTVPAYVLGAADRRESFQPALHAELKEVAGGWVREWSDVASRVTVPVHYRLAELDNLWVAGEDGVTAFAAALRAGSPYVDAALFPGSSHVIANSIAGYEYRFQVLGFAERCAAAATTPELLGRAPQS